MAHATPQEAEELSTDAEEDMAYQKRMELGLGVGKQLACHEGESPRAKNAFYERKRKVRCCGAPAPRRDHAAAAAGGAGLRCCGRHRGTRLHGA